MTRRPTDVVSVDLGGHAAAVLGEFEVREVRAARGGSGYLLRIGELCLVIQHRDAGEATLSQVTPDGRALWRAELTEAMADALAEWAAGPLRLDVAGVAGEGLSYCGPCIQGDHGACKGSDRCECDHNVASAAQERGRGPQPG